MARLTESHDYLHRNDLFDVFQSGFKIHHSTEEQESEKVKILLLAYKARNGQAPRYLQDLITPHSPNSALHFQSAGLLDFPRISKSRTGGQAFCYQTPLLWNQLPIWVKEADTPSIFKTKLKTFLFSKAYS